MKIAHFVLARCSSSLQNGGILSSRYQSVFLSAFGGMVVLPREAKCTICLQGVGGHGGASTGSIANEEDIRYQKRQNNTQLVLLIFNQMQETNMKFRSPVWFGNRSCKRSSLISDPIVHALAELKNRLIGLRICFRVDIDRF
jgi:hypothetical protein